MVHEFKVRLDGVEMSSTEVQVLNASIQQTVLAHLATLDRRGDVTALFRPENGGTNGIVAVSVKPVEGLSQRVSEALDAFE
jgi:hypothetical protein